MDGQCKCDGTACGRSHGAPLLGYVAGCINLAVHKGTGFCRACWVRWPGSGMIEAMQQGRIERRKRDQQLIKDRMRARNLPLPGMEDVK